MFKQLQNANFETFTVVMYQVKVFCVDTI